MNSLHLTCPKHNDSQVLFICLHSNCSQRRKCCLTCIDNDHKSHQIISVRKFVEQTNSILQRYNSHPEKQRLLKLLSINQSVIREEINSIRNSFNQKIDLIQTQMLEKFNHCRKVFFFPFKQTVESHLAKTIQHSDLSINGYIKDIQQVKNIQIGSLKDMTQFVYIQTQLMIESISQQTQEFFNTLTVLQKQLRKFTLSGKKISGDLNFSQIHRAPNIQLADSINTISGYSSSHSYTICAADHPFDPANNKFFVQITRNPTKKVWLGACILQTVRRSNFSGCYGHTKGTYAIDQSSNYSYNYNNPNNYATVSNHHQTQFNSVGYNMHTTGWNFKQGDVIMVQIDFLGKNIWFYNMNLDYDPENEESVWFLNDYTMPIDFREGTLYPFVGFNGVSNDLVRILSKEQICQLVKPYGNSWSQHISQEELDMDVLQSL